MATRYDYRRPRSLLSCAIERLAIHLRQRIDDARRSPRRNGRFQNPTTPLGKGIDSSGQKSAPQIAQESTPFQSQTRSMDAFDVQYLLYSHGHLVADDAPNRRIPRQKFVDDEYLGRCHRLYMRLGLDHDVLSLGAKRSA